MNRLGDLGKAVGGYLLAGSLFVGSIVGAEKSGLTDACVDFDYGMCQVYHEVHKRHPWLVWQDIGDPKVNPEGKKAKYRLRRNIDIGLTGTLIGFIGIGLGVESLIRRRARKKRNPYTYKGE